MFSVVCFCHSVHGEGGPCTGPHPQYMTLSLDIFNLDLTDQGSPPQTCSNLFTLKCRLSTRRAVGFRLKCLLVKSRESFYINTNVLFPWQQVTNSISQLGQNILQSTALSGLPMPETQQRKQQTILVTTQQQGKQLLPQQHATAQQQLSTEPLQQQLLSAPVKIVPRITELTEQRQHMSQEQVATTQATMQQQMHITGPQVKSEDRKLLLPGYAQTPDLSPGSLDGQVQQSHKASNIIDSSTSALAILADSSLQHHHSDSRLSHASSSATAIPTANTTTTPIISTGNVSNVTDASGAKHVQSSILFTSGLASVSGIPTAQYTVPPIANIMSSLKSAGGVGGPPQTAASLTSLNLPAACTAGTSTSFLHVSSENTLPLTAISEASTNIVPPQVLGIQQIAAQIIQEAKKQERKVTESTTTKPSDTTSTGTTS